jgi:N-acetyl-anhydromuramyl-L-alanine amidase AmpD
MKKLNFPKDQYLQDVYDKTQIVLHHTVSNGSANAVANWWKSNKQRVATAYIIDKLGVIHELFDPKYYAGHIGSVKKTVAKLGIPARNCSKNSIGIELISIGPLVKNGNKLIDAYGKEYNDPVVHYPNKFRGYEYFAEYTEKQINATIELLKYLTDRFEIPKSVKPEDFNDVSVEALTAVPGIYSHVSFRQDKSDIHPQGNFIEELIKL